MRHLGKLALGVVALAIAGIGGAQAGDVCKKAVTEEGGCFTSERAAKRSAIKAWENCVRDEHGAAFANWWYSGDRTISCTWTDDKVPVYTCAAKALPCGRVR
jgi:hypothetical protein